MKISGFQSFSLNEYPGEISAIVFTQGCNFNCRYCFNPDLKPIDYVDGSRINSGDVLESLRSKRGKLTAVTLTGGEPLIQDDIMEFLGELSMMKYKVKLNTNGSNHVKLQFIIEWGLVHYISMDIKATPEKYEDIACCPVDMDSIKNSIDIIKKSRIPHVFNTVLDRDVLEDSDIKKIMEWINDDRNYKVGEKK